MWALYKKEIFSFFRSMTGYVYIGFFLLVAGIFFMAFNLQGGVAEFGYVLGNTTTVLLIVIPMLTMRLLCEEQKQKTDQLLFTVPIKVWEIVLGKYLAALTIFAAPLAILALCPLVLSLYGQIPMLESYSCFLAFLFMGGACVAVGLLVSSLTDHPILAAVGTFALLLLSYLANGISGMIGSAAIDSLVGFSGAMVLGALLVGLLSKSKTGALAFLIAGEAVLGAVYWLRPSIFEGAFANFLGAFSMFGRYYDFVDGVFDLGHLIYYLSVAVLFLIFTVQAVKRRRRSDSSIYVCVMCILVTAAAVLANLIAGQIPGRIMKYDTSSTAIYSLSAQTEEIAAGLEQPVSLYLIAPRGEEDETLTRLLERYEELSDQITVACIDPVLSPDFVSQYTSNKVSDNSILVVGENRVRVLRNSDLYPSSYDYETGGISSYFDGEGQITGAIRSVTTKELSTLYILTGHGENELTEQFQNALEKEGIELKNLNLTGAGQVPEDADCLMLNVPVSDLTKEESESMGQYLQNGGKLLLLTGISAAEQPNLELLLSGYGIRPQQGMILETDGNYCVPSYPNFLLPQISSDAITDPLIQEDALVLLPNSHGIEIMEDKRSTVDVKALLRTSQNSYLKTDTSTLSYEEGDLRGPFNVMITASEQTAYGETKIVWISNSNLLTNEMDEMVGGNNTDLILNSLGWMIEQDGGISIRPKMMASQPLRLTSAQAAGWGALFGILIPAATVIFGAAVCVKRRKQQ